VISREYYVIARNDVTESPVYDDVDMTGVVILRMLQPTAYRLTKAT